MTETVPTAEPEVEHPDWCNRVRCTYIAPHGDGSHESVHRRIELASGNTLTVFVEQLGAGRDPMLTLEERGCSCTDCEPISFFSLSAEAALRLQGLIGSLLNPDTKRADRMRQWIDTGSGGGFEA